MTCMDSSDIRTASGLVEKDDGTLIYSMVAKAEFICFDAVKAQSVRDSQSEVWVALCLSPEYS